MIQNSKIVVYIYFHLPYQLITTLRKRKKKGSKFLFYVLKIIEVSNKKGIARNL